MKPDRDALKQLRDEATDQFIGHGGVIGVGIGQNDQLIILLSKPAPRQQQAIRGWANERAVTVDVIVTGEFIAASNAPAPPM